MTIPASDRILAGHVDEDTAYVVDDYPYGFRLRCKIRYWIETTKNGDRLVSQTTNPKVAGEPWSNKPKKSTYSDVGVMFLDDEDHVKWTALGTWATADEIRRFIEVTEGKLTEKQTSRTKAMLIYRRVYDAMQSGRKACEADEPRIVPRELLVGPDGQAEVGDNTPLAQAWYKGWDAVAAKREVAV